MSANQKPVKTDFVLLTVPYLEKIDGHWFFKTKIEKISREEYEEKYEMKMKTT